MIGINTDSNSSLLQQVQQKQNTLLERLATGRRVNSAADDSAAQQIIDRLTSQVEGNRQAIRNAYDGISLSQVAESGLQGINQDAQRIRDTPSGSLLHTLDDTDQRFFSDDSTFY